MDIEFSLTEVDKRSMITVLNLMEVFASVDSPERQQDLAYLHL